MKLILIHTLYGHLGVMQVNHIATLFLFAFVFVYFISVVVFFVVVATTVAFFCFHWERSGKKQTHLFRNVQSEMNEMNEEKKNCNYEVHVKSLYSINTISHCNGHCPRKCENNTQSMYAWVCFFLCARATNETKKTHTHTTCTCRLELANGILWW